MSSRAAGQFDKELLRLFAIRTHQLRASLWPTVGKAPRLTRKQIRRSINELQDIAEADFFKSRYGKRLLKDFDDKRQWHPKRGKGFGWRAKRSSFKKWYQNKIFTKNCVYAFWGKSRCLYIGRTLNGKGRPSSHFEKAWFGKARRLDIFSFQRKRDVPRFECVMTHRHKPSEAGNKPAKRSYYSPCDVCAGRKLIRDEVRRIFRLR
jgi:hypothetical protein